ncbi:exo-alpha-sialidase, partial [Trypanosoma cruzi]
ARGAPFVSSGRHPSRPAARRSAIPSGRREVKDCAVDLDAPRSSRCGRVCVCVCSGCPNSLAPQMRQRKDVVAWRRQCHLNQTVPVTHTQTGKRKEGLFVWAAGRIPKFPKEIKYDGKGE